MGDGLHRLPTQDRLTTGCASALAWRSLMPMVARSKLDESRAAATAELQREWFGRPLNDLFGAVIDACDLTQAQLADHLGISAPMVSQLMTGRREKPGNPLVQERVIDLVRLLDDLDARRIDVDQLASHVAIPAPTAQRESHKRPPTTATDARSTAQVVRNLLASVASAEELLDAAKVLQRKHPDLAEVIRVYGTGRTSEAEAHLRAHGLV